AALAGFACDSFLDAAIPRLVVIAVLLAPAASPAVRRQVGKPKPTDRSEHGAAADAMGQLLGNFLGGRARRPARLQPTDPPLCPRRRQAAARRRPGVRIFHASPPKLMFCVRPLVFIMYLTMICPYCQPQNEAV